MKNKPLDIVLLTLKIKDIYDIVIAKQRVRQISQLLNFDIHNQMKIMTVVSEILCNACLYAVGGKIQYCLRKTSSSSSFMVKITDKGPGISHISPILTDQTDIPIGGGLGIINSKKIMDKFEIKLSKKGTVFIGEIDLPKTISINTSDILTKISAILAKPCHYTDLEELQQHNQEIFQTLGLISSERNNFVTSAKERTSQTEIFNHCLENEMKGSKNIDEWIYKKQQVMVHSERINMLSELASTMAHELNQPLAAITTYAKGCIMHLKNNDCKIDEVIKIMKAVEHQAKRAGEIIHHIKNFMSQRELVKTKADINQIIKETILLLQSEIKKHGCTINFELGNFLGLVYVDVIQIQQAISQLILFTLNAQHEANTINPTILIKTTVFKRNMLKVNIINNGLSVKIKELEILLKNYFNSPKYSIGISLSISRTIIEAHGGKLIIKNNPEGGTCFEFILLKKKANQKI